MQKQNRLSSISQWITILLLPILILLSILQVCAVDEKFYFSEFEKYNIQKTTGLSQSEAKTITIHMIQYLKDKKKNLDPKLSSGRQAFNEKEKKHMEDVKALFQKGEDFRNFSIFLAMIAIFLLIRTSNNAYKQLCKILLRSFILSLFLGIILYIWIKTDFYRYFTYFHEIFFTNDLWLLDPKKDLLIQMLPLGFFKDLVIKVMSWFAGIMIFIGFMGYYCLKKQNSFS